MKNNTICLFIFDTIRMFFRRLSCLAFGHIKNCYMVQEPDAEKLFHKMRKDLELPPSKWWMLENHGWCAYCGQHTKEPVRLRK